jgi:hypothetical protein
MIIEYREIKSKIPALYSATPEPPPKPFKLYLLPKTKPIDKNTQYSESWKYD